MPTDRKPIVDAELAKLMREYRAKLALAKKVYEDADSLMEQILMEATPGEVIVRGKGSKVGLALRDRFSAHTHKVWHSTACTRFEIEEVTLS